MKSFPFTLMQGAKAKQVVGPTRELEDSLRAEVRSLRAPTLLRQATTLPFSSASATSAQHARMDPFLSCPASHVQLGLQQCCRCR